jgi:diguanylate cyclase (GGDEF)-like protein/PAS domain S-box-containing protein
VRLPARLPLSPLSETENSPDAVPAPIRGGAAALPGRLGAFALGAGLALAASLFAGAEPRPRLVLVAAVAGVLGLFGRELVRSIRERAEESRSILESAHDAFISVDAAGRIRQWNRQAELDFGWSREEAIGREMAGLIVPERLREAYRERLRAVLRSEEGAGLGRRREEIAMRRDGSELPVEVSFSAVQTARGMRVNSFVHDISERRAANAHLREAEERFRRAFDDAAIGMALTSPEGRWLRVNRALCAITGYPAEKLTGLAFREITHPEDRGRDVDALRAMIAGELERFQTEKRYFHADGHVIWVSLNVSIVRDEDGKPLHLISQMQDISERKQAEERLAYQASHDSLTDLPNRALLDDRMSVALGRLRRTPLPLVVLFCDLDRFKLVNDSFGHDAGDRLLLEAGERLRGLVRPSDTVARLGGDEFAILCEEMSPDAAATLARRIGDALADPFEIVPGHEVVVTSSIGIAINRDPSVEPGALLANADAAMYEAKTRGRSRYSFFAPEMRTRASDRLELESELRNALTDGAFDVHFQPQLELATGRVGVRADRGGERPDRRHRRLRARPGDRGDDPLARRRGSGPDRDRERLRSPAQRARAAEHGRRRRLPAAAPARGALPRGDRVGGRGGSGIRLRGAPRPQGPRRVAGDRRVRHRHLQPRPDAAHPWARRAQGGSRLRRRAGRRRARRGAGRGDPGHG